MAKQFSVTYERWNESALEAGATDDSGFAIEDVSLGDAIRYGLELTRPDWCGEVEPSDSRVDHARWLTFYKWNDGTHEYYTTGIEEIRALHIPEHITPSSRKRIARLFRIKA